MSIELTKFQKQGLGKALSNVGYRPDAFVYDTDNNSVVLTNRTTSDKFIIKYNLNSYIVSESVPGTTRTQNWSGQDWDTVERMFQDWAKRVKLESEAVDPWKQEAEDMAEDDSYFTLAELPRVDKAIEASLEELKNIAVVHGKNLEQIEVALDETRQLLVKSARNSTKREWLALFKGIIIEKLVDWGLQTELFQDILRTLITSAHDVAQLAEHASRHILN